MAGIYERVAPSVVHVRVVQHISETVSSGVKIPQFPGWPDFFDLPDQPQEFYRRGEERQIAVTLGERPGE